jgi:cephalosporin hydroxylase
MNDLQRFFETHEGNLIHKWVHYFDIYDRYFSRYRGTDVHIVEIGVSHGGSLALWKDYFGPRARFYGVDINPACKQFEDEQVSIFIGDQGDRAFLRHLARALPRIDVLIDDGGHTMEQQIATFEELYPYVAPDGIFLCEDTHTSYWVDYGGGYKKPGTFIEYTKDLIDSLHAWHCREPDAFEVTDFTRSTFGMHFYDSIVVLEKRPREAPRDEKTGHPTLPVEPVYPMGVAERDRDAER